MVDQAAREALDSQLHYIVELWHKSSQCLEAVLNTYAGWAATKHLLLEHRGKAQAIDWRLGAAVAAPKYADMTTKRDSLNNIAEAIGNNWVLWESTK